VITMNSYLHSEKPLLVVDHDRVVYANEPGKDRIRDYEGITGSPFLDLDLLAKTGNVDIIAAADILPRDYNPQEVDMDLVLRTRLATDQELARGVLHHINQPLTVISGNAQLLQLKGHDNGDSEELIAGILTGVDCVGDLGGDLNHLVNYGDLGTVKPVLYAGREYMIDFKRNS